MKAACAIILAAFSAVAVKGADIEGVVTFWRSPDPYFFMETASGAVWRVQRDTKEPRVSVGDIVSVGGYGIKGVPCPFLAMSAFPESAIVAFVTTSFAGVEPPEGRFMPDATIPTVSKIWCVFPPKAM